MVLPCATQQTSLRHAQKRRCGLARGSRQLVPAAVLRAFSVRLILEREGVENNLRTIVPRQSTATPPQWYQRFEMHPCGACMCSRLQFFLSVNLAVSVGLCSVLLFMTCV